MIAPLSARDRTLLRLALRLVPSGDRDDWTRTWLGELWHRSHPRAHITCSAIDLYPGLLRDALWLRTESFRRAVSGTAILCIAVLGISVLLAIVPLLWMKGLHFLLLFFATNLLRFTCQASLVTIVGLGTSSHHIERTSTTGFSAQLRGDLFQATKVVLVLVTAMFLSNDVTQPFHASHPLVSEILQSQFFVVLALLGLRWSFEDSGVRCKQCLRALASPVRVGPPSRNFLDANGTELVCEAGHGLLSIPEIETSWRSSSWIPPNSSARFQGDNFG